MGKFESHLDSVRRELQRRQERALESASQFVLGEVSLRVPVDKGNLKGSYHRKLDLRKMIVFIGTNVLYAPFVEFGTGIYAESGAGRKTAWAYQDDKGNWRITRGAKPQPHLRPAYADNRERVKRLMIREMKR